MGVNDLTFHHFHSFWELSLRCFITFLLFYNTGAKDWINKVFFISRFVHQMIMNTFLLQLSILIRLKMMYARQGGVWVLEVGSGHEMRIWFTIFHDQYYTVINNAQHSPSAHNIGAGLVGKQADTIVKNIYSPSLITSSGKLWALLVIRFTYHNSQHVRLKMGMFLQNLPSHLCCCACVDVDNIKHHWLLLLLMLYGYLSDSTENLTWL